MIWLTSDTHFHHSNIIDYCNRPFNSVTEMDELMVERWNECVRPSDVIVHLGDFSFGDPSTILKYLNGVKILIFGNHDRRRTVGYFIQKGFYAVFKLPMRCGQYVFSHEQVYSSYLKRFGLFNFHGHTHTKFTHPPYRSVCVEVCNYRPIPLVVLKDLSFVDANLVYCDGLWTDHIKDTPRVLIDRLTC